DLTPARMAPSPVAWQFFWREMRVRDQRRCALAEGEERVVQRRISKLMIGGIHHVTSPTVDPIRERATRMVEQLHADLEATELQCSRSHQCHRWLTRKVVERHRKVR